MGGFRAQFRCSRFQAKIEEIDQSNVTPADYTVVVRGLPPDVTKDEASIWLMLVIHRWSPIVRATRGRPRGGCGGEA